MATYTPDSLRTLFQSSFNLEQWYSFLQHFFNATELKSTPERINETTSDEGYYLGNIDTTDSYRIGLFQYNIIKGSVANKRVGLRNLVKSFINPTWGVFDAALVVFDSGDHWRLSFICDIKDEATSPKRYTYVFGSNDLLYRTPIERFNLLKTKGISFENLKTAFSVEALSKEFFAKYKWHYERFCQYLYENKCNENIFGKAFATWEDKILRDYVKKMLGRLVFIQYIYQKGWAPNLLEAFDSHADLQDNFLDAYLEPLFGGILNTAPELRKNEFEKNKHRGWNISLVDEFKNVPYLNGGLFENDLQDPPRSKFPADYFKDLFTFFTQYNFTIDENDPNDAVVGVDPEMLGHIFENLLEDNKDKGAFYTPKEIVRYMCQESLIAYLETNTSIAKDKIRHFVLSPEVGVAEIPENKKPKLLTALEEVKICDPAIGSGAFPMGLLNELLHCREVLSDEHYDRAEIKKCIIQNNIYGVDIEKGAVDIARLRFWLSIVVDEETPSPLPNLDYKIMQGNSLIESFMGINLSIMTYEKEHKKDTGELTLFDDEINKLQKTVSHLLSSYYSCSDHDKKMELQQEIADTINKQLEAQSYSSSIISELKKINLAENNKFFLWHTWFSDVFNRDDKEGFDIVIGNPPYVQLQNNGGELAKLYENCRFQTFAKTGDIYCLFYEKGWQLLRQQGHLCFITSNKWMRAGYGEKTRGFFAKHTNPKYLIDFAGVKIFDNATVDTNILLFGKGQNEYQTRCAVTDKLNKESLKNLSDFVQQQSVECRFDSSDSWVILSPIEQSIKRKIESVGTPLKDWDIQINYGIKTGFNDAFIINTEKRNEILDNCSSEEERTKTAELIRPILRGRDIKRYGYDWANLWLINTHNGIKGVKPRIDINDYPAVKAHLDQYWDKISKRADKGDTPYNLRNCAYLDDFNQPKIVFQEIVQESQFLLDANENFFCNDTGRIIVGKHLYHLLGILNSELFFFSVKHFYGGGVLGEHGIRMKHTFFENFPCLAFDERIESIAKKLQQFYSNTLNHNLNDYIMTLYQLTDEEKLYVKGKLIQFPQNQ